MTETLVQLFVTHLGGKAAKELIIFKMCIRDRACTIGVANNRRKRNV